MNPNRIVSISVSKQWLILSLRGIRQRYELRLFFKDFFNSSVYLNDLDRIKISLICTNIKGIFQNFDENLILFMSDINIFVKNSF